MIEKFSNANIARLDTDVAKSRKSVTDTLQNFSKGKIDILLGTQMIAKGLDFENVTLVGRHIFIPEIFPRVVFLETPHG